MPDDQNQTTTPAPDMADLLAAVGYHDMAAQALEENWPAARIAQELKRARKLDEIRAARPTGPAIHTGANAPATDWDVLRAASLLRLNGGEDLALKSYAPQTVERARALGHRHTLDLLADACKLAGLQVSSRNPQALLRAAFSHADIDGILSNTANKSMMSGYQSFPSVARTVARKLTVKDFKLATSYRMTGDTKFAQLGPGASIEHGELGESSYTHRAYTYAKMLSITRNDIINDDLNALDDVPRILGRGAAQQLEHLFFELLLANTGSFFGAGNSNYQSGASTALASAGLKSAAELLLKQTDENGYPVNISPKFLLVPPELSVTADELFASTVVLIGGGSTTADDRIPSVNAFAGKYRPLVSPYLSNSSYTGYSATAWYLLADPADVAAFGIAYLDGVETPTVEQRDADFDKLGIQMRAFIDFGVTQVDFRGGVKSAGA